MLFVFSILVVGFLVVHQIAVAIDPGPVEAARTHCIQQGWQPNQINLLRWQATSWSGFQVTGFVDFRLVDHKSGHFLHVTVYRPHAFAS